MSSIGELLQTEQDYLNAKGSLCSRLSVELILSKVLNIKHLDIYLHWKKILTHEEIATVKKYIYRRGTGEPVEYILGKTIFYDCDLVITPAVLIPRPETEILVDLIVKILEQVDLRGKKLWDIGCGSGCIGLALKKRFPLLEVTLSDISEDALLVAQENAKHNELQVNFKKGDLLAPFEKTKADFIVCNPPYISANEYFNLSKEVRDFEPKGALLAENNGLAYFEKLADNLASFLDEQGKAFFEIGANQKEGVENIFSKKSEFSFKTLLDWSGKDRFFFLELEPSSYVQ